jgi:MFS family permease
MTTIAICCSYNYYGIILNLGKMKGNFYLNSIFAFLGECVCELISGKLADKYGRILIFLCSCILGIIGYILYLISPSFKFIFVFIAMLGFAGIFNIMCIYMPEIYPTKIRNITYSYTSFISRITPIIIPILSQNFPKLIDYSFILSGVINGLLGMTLEETLGKKLLDIIPEEEEQNENLKLKFLKE